MMGAKLNKFSLDKARELAQEFNETNKYNKNSMIKPLPEINEDTLNKLSDLQSRILKQYFTQLLLPKAIIKKEINPNEYKNVWVISDTHFSHSNILYFENRIDKLSLSRFVKISKHDKDNFMSLMERDTDDILEEHDNRLIENWNSVIGAKDLVYIVGDFSFGKPERTMEILKQLNGDKSLIIGNHDCIFLDSKKFDKSLFVEINSYKEINYKGQNIVMCHYPLLQFKHMEKTNNIWVLLFGHIHSSILANLPNHSFNVGADANNYMPIRLEDAIQKALSNNNGNLNGRKEVRY